MKASTMAGFTLIEVTIVLLTVSLLLGMVLDPLGTSFDQHKRRAAKIQLEEIYLASIGFAQSKGRLPCPASASSGSQEPPACINPHGFVPAAVLGLQGIFNNKNQLLDPWNNPIRYSVSLADSLTHGNVGVADYVNVGEMKAVGLSHLKSDFSICSKKVSSACPLNFTRVNQVPLVIYSTGRNPSADYDSAENQDGDSVFISRGYSQQAGDDYDDLVIWLSENILFTKLISSGVLP